MTTKNNTVGVSTGVLHHWVAGGDWIQNQLKIIDILSPYTRRVELRFPAEELLTMNDEAIAQYQERLKNFNASFHLPKLAGHVGRLNELARAIDRLVKKLGFEYCVMHADEYAKLALWNKPFHLSSPFGLENSDIRKFGFQHLADLDIFAGMPIVLDICHLEEMEPDCYEREMKSLKNPVLAVHFSAPANEAIKEYPYIRGPHFPFFNSGLTPPESLPKKAPIIIEGVMPQGETGWIANEINFIAERYL